MFGLHAHVVLEQVGPVRPAAHPPAGGGKRTEIDRPLQAPEVRRGDQPQLDAGRVERIPEFAHIRVRVAGDHKQGVVDARDRDQATPILVDAGP